MHLDLNKIEAKAIYKVLASLVVPRPIAWVSSIGLDGVTNLAPFSFFNVMGVRPPIVAFAPGNKLTGEPKDTARNILEVKDFVVNLLDESLVEQMTESAKSHAATVSEIEVSGLTAVDSVAVSAPRILESPVSLECKLVETLCIGENRMVIGEVLHVHVRDGILDEESLDLLTEEYYPIGRMASPNKYCRTKDQFKQE